MTSLEEFQRDDSLTVEMREKSQSVTVTLIKPPGDDWGRGKLAQIARAVGGSMSLVPNSLTDMMEVTFRSRASKEAILELVGDSGFNGPSIELIGGNMRRKVHPNSLSKK